MLLDRFYKYFPVPKFLKLSTVGVDISDESIKYVEVVEGAKGIRLGRYGDVDLPLGAVVGGKIADRAKLVQALSALRSKNNFKYVHASLPEEETFVARLVIPWMPLAELRGSIEMQLEEYIPLSVNDAVFDFEIYDAPKDNTGNYIVSVFSAPKKVVADYSEALREGGLEPASLEIEVQSAARALVPPGDQGTYLIADLGKTRTGFSIVSHGVVMFATTIKSMGGETLTRAAAKALGVSTEEAEQQKIKKGLLNSPDNRPLFEALVPVVSLFKDEINRHFTYWNSVCEEGEAQDPIGRVVFCGGQASLPGLVEYISADLPVPVEVGNPWSAFNLGKELPPLDFRTSLRYGAAIGLALRGMGQKTK